MSLEVESMARRKFEAAQDGSQKKVKLEPQGAGVCDNKLFYAERASVSKSFSNKIIINSGFSNLFISLIFSH